nr:endo alpha-1,4 polygalactosaminidase [Acholeplasmatales bacterium]
MRLKKSMFFTLLFSLLIILCGCKKENEDFEILSYDYGVFLGASADDMDYMKQFKTIVIDAQYYTNDEINELKQNDNMVISYINVGAIENFRDYYNDYYDITLSNYENWEEERWVDVSQDKWKDFIINDLSTSILNKGVDGLFIDNLDVYYQYENDNIFNGITYIMRQLKKKTYISINGGDTYVYKYLEL